MRKHFKKLLMKTFSLTVMISMLMSYTVFAEEGLADVPADAKTPELTQAASDTEEEVTDAKTPELTQETSDAEEEVTDVETQEITTQPEEEVKTEFPTVSVSGLPTTVLKPGDSGSFTVHVDGHGADMTGWYITSSGSNNCFPEIETNKKLPIVNGKVTIPYRIPQLVSVNEIRAQFFVYDALGEPLWDTSWGAVNPVEVFHIADVEIPEGDLELTMEWGVGKEGITGKTYPVTMILKNTTVTDMKNLSVLFWSEFYFEDTTLWGKPDAPRPEHTFTEYPEGTTILNDEKKKTTTLYNINLAAGETITCKGTVTFPAPLSTACMYLVGTLPDGSERWGGSEWFSIVEAPTPEPTPEATPEPTPETTPEPTPEATPELTPEATPELTPVVFVPKIIAGAGSTWNSNSSTGLTVKSDAEFADFVKVLVDGKEVAKDNYTVSEGSTIVTLKPDYLASLSVGNHTIEIVSRTGTAATNFTIADKPLSNIPETGDASPIILLIIMMVISAFGGTVVFRKNRMC